MKCPKCGKEMTKGAITARTKSKVYWGSDEFFKHTINNLFTGKSVKNAGGICIPLKNGITNDRTNAWACSECGMVLIDCN